MGAQNIANGSASLEPDFSANTINTTWYSNGEQLTGNNIPGTCRYDAALTPPTPAPRPGYVFGGWKVKVPCLIPSRLATTNGSNYGYKNDSTGAYGEDSVNARSFGLTEDNTWVVIWSNGDKVLGEVKCSALEGDSRDDHWGGNSADWTASESELTNASGEAKYCWCKATHYTANNAQQCSLSSPAWVFRYENFSADGCAGDCAFDCVDYVRRYSVFRVALFGANVAQ